MWTYFKAWYGCDYTLLRFVKKDGASGELYIELYPEKILQEEFQAIKEASPSGQHSTRKGVSVLNTSFDGSILGTHRDLKLTERNEEHKLKMA